jgi:hypothetical protein
MHPETPKLRDTLVTEWRAMRDRRFGPEGRAMSVPARQAVFEAEQNLKLRYWDSLPRIPISRCPTDRAVVHKQMDIFGLDGPWWEVRAYDEPPFGDSHVITYTGALRFGTLQPLAQAPQKRGRILPGPEVPFLIPRLLQMTGVRCVLSSLPLFGDRSTAYFITYFADPPLDARFSHPMWLRETFHYIDANGHPRWSARTDAWDFDIARQLLTWHEKIYWIEPGDPELTLVTGGPERCPYARMAGVQRPRLIEKGAISPLPLPQPPVTEDEFD